VQTELESAHVAGKFIDPGLKNPQTQALGRAFALFSLLV
jgi:hypothetical protein